MTQRAKQKARAFSGGGGSKSLGGGERKSFGGGRSERRRGKGEGEGESNVSESGRYECETCGRCFCIDCDVFAHEVVHNCPGCQSREGELLGGR